MEVATFIGLVSDHYQQGYHIDGFLPIFARVTNLACVPMLLKCRPYHVLHHTDFTSSLKRHPYHVLRLNCFYMLSVQGSPNARLPLELGQELTLCGLDHSNKVIHTRSLVCPHAVFLWPLEAYLRNRGTQRQTWRRGGA